MISVPDLARTSILDSVTESVLICQRDLAKLALGFALAMTVGGSWKMARAQTKATTTTTMAMTSNGKVVTRVASGSVVTLTASVSSGTTALTTGQVNFCDASAQYCRDIHLLGTAQLTSKGWAVLKLRPGIGSHSYKAVFLGTNNYAASSAASSSLAVTGVYPTTATIEQSGSPANYTLTATVTGIINEPNVPAPTGKVSFVDITTNNMSLGTAALGAGNLGLSFMNSSSPAMTQQSNAVAAADFNGDGIQDLAVSDSNSGQVLLAILLGNGDGTFRATTTSPTVGLYPDSIAVGDFNSDGVPDLAVTSVDQNNVTILLGNGDGTFSANAPNLNTGSTPQSVAAGDFNGDGIPDLAVVNANSVLIFLGNGNGTFSPAAVSPSTGSGPINVAVGDFNSDGNADLAITNSGSGTVTILLGRGDGTFQATAVSPATGGSPDGLAIADFNGDGIPDIAVSNYSGINGNAVMILQGIGDGTFQTATANSAPGLNFHSVAVADFNGDGVADLAVGEFWHGFLAVLLGRGDGTFAAAIAVDAKSQLGSGYIAVADFDGNGIPDLAVPNQGGTVPILLSEPTLTVTATISGISPTGPSPQKVYANYPGDSNYGSSISGTTTLIIQAATPTISPTSGTYGSPQTITIADSTTGATIYYLASGIVQTGGYVQYSGPITLSRTGVESISAYAVAPNYAQSALLSAAYTLVQDFTFAPPSGAPTSATVAPGGQATYLLAVTPPTGSSTAATTTFSVTGLPIGATGTFSPSSVPANSRPTNVTLTVNVPGTVTAQTGTKPFHIATMLGAVGLILFPFWGSVTRRSLRMRRLLLLGFAAVLVAEGGCGGGGNKPPAAQTYTLTVTAKSGLLSHTTTLSLTVQ